MEYIKIDDKMRLKILRNKPIKIDERLTIKQYTINEMIDVIEDYDSMVYLLVNSPYEIRASLFEAGVLYSELTHWRRFIGLFANNKTSVPLCKGFKLFFGLDISSFKIIGDENSCSLVDETTGYEIDEFKFIHCVSIYREIMGFENIEPIFASEATMIYAIEREIRRIKKKRNMSNITMNSQAEAIWVNLHVKIEDVFNMTLYQFNRAVYRIDKDKNYHGNLTGIYTGNIKADDVDFNKVSWISK